MRALTVEEIDAVSGATTYAVNTRGGGTQVVADGFRWTYSEGTQYKNGDTYLYGYNS